MGTKSDHLIQRVVRWLASTCSRLAIIATLVLVLLIIFLLGSRTALSYQCLLGPLCARETSRLLLLLVFFYLVLRGCASSMWPLAGPVVDDPVPEQRQINTCVNLQLFFCFPSSPHTHTHTRLPSVLFFPAFFSQRPLKKGTNRRATAKPQQTKTHTNTPQISCDFPATSRRQQRKGEPAKIHRFFMPAREAANIMMGTRRAPVLVLFLRGSLKLVFGGGAAVWRAKSRIRRTWCRG